MLDAVLRTATGIEQGPPAWAIWPETSNRGASDEVSAPRGTSAGSRGEEKHQARGGPSGYREGGKEESFRVVVSDGGPPGVEGK